MIRLAFAVLPNDNRVRFTSAAFTANFREKEEKPMSTQNHQCLCCPECSESAYSGDQWEITRRRFAAAGGLLMSALTLKGLQSALYADETETPLLMPKPRTPLIVKPILCHDVSQRREAASWRRWGDIQSVEAANEEIARIKTELDGVKQRADYPIDVLDISRCTDAKQMTGHPDVEKCDVVLFYGAGDGIYGVEKYGKDVIVFQRWNSGPVYRHIITVSARFLRQHTDEQMLPGIRNSDVVVDDPEELDWRFRALCGLKNTVGSKIITIGGAGAWSQPAGVVPELAKKFWKFEYHDVDYTELKKLIEEAKNDEKVMARAKKRADAYLKIPGTTLETEMDFFVHGFVLDEVFRLLMKKVDTNLITVNSCMGTIMPTSKTTACMTLTTLNDDGYLAFCESDFVVIPSGVLLGNICGKPVFLGNPGFPFKKTSTICHCTAPRKMDGKNYDPVRIVTHYESDYGAAPWVKVPLGTVTTHIAPSFKSDRWVGLKGTIVDVPFKPSACRTQITVRRECSDELLADNLVGFHWMTCFGDYRKEIGYALRRIGIPWHNLDEAAAK